MNTDLEAQKALDRIQKDGIEALSATEKTVATVWLFAAGVFNNGFVGYFSSHRGDLASEAPAALRTIGALRTAEIAAEANAVFGLDGPPRECEARRQSLHDRQDVVRPRLSALDQRVMTCEENLDELLEKFLIAQAE